MKINVGENIYQIFYSHQRDPARTFCYIARMLSKIPRAELGFTIVGKGEAVCSKQDHFNYATGRKVSLTRALRAAFPDKKHRTYAWTTIWETRKQISKKPWTV